MRRKLNEAREFGRLLQPMHDLERADGSAALDDILVILDVNATDAAAQPKKITLSGVASIVAPLIPPVPASTAGPERSVQFATGSSISGVSQFTYNYNTNTVAVSGLVGSEGLVVNASGILIKESKTPASEAEPTNKGNIVYDSSYIYVAVADNTWKRTPLSWGSTLQHPYAGTYVIQNFETPIVTPGVFEIASGTWATTTASYSMNSIGGCLHYLGNEPRHFHAVCQATMSAAVGNNQNTGLGIYKYTTAAASGVVLPHSIVENTLGSNERQQVTTHADFSMASGDYACMAMTNYSTTNALDLVRGYIFAMGMFDL